MMDPSTTLALVARVREVEERLTVADLHHYRDEQPLPASGRHICHDCFHRWPCPTHLAIHPECADDCQHVGGAQ